MTLCKDRREQDKYFLRAKGREGTREEQSSAENNNANDFEQYHLGSATSVDLG